MESLEYAKYSGQLIHGLHSTVYSIFTEVNFFQLVHQNSQNTFFYQAFKCVFGEEILIHFYSNGF